MSYTPNNRIAALTAATNLMEKRRDELFEEYGERTFSVDYERKKLPPEVLEEYDNLIDGYRMIQADKVEYQQMLDGYQVEEGGRHKDFKETHPSYAVISVSRPQGGDGIFFGCQSRHPHFISMTISHASRARSLSSDYIHSEKDILEVQMSYEQWAKVVSGAPGQACPATLRHYRGENLAAPEQISNNTLHMKEFLEEVEKIRQMIDEELPAELVEPLTRKGTLTKTERNAIAGQINNLKNRFSSGNGFAFLSKQYLEFVDKVENEVKIDVEAWLKLALENEINGTKLIDG